MPDLGKYAFAVLGAYGVTLVALAVLVGISLWRHRAVRRQLAAAEARMGKRHG